jgi:hypothetical protein
MSAPCRKIGTIQKHTSSVVWPRGSCSSVFSSSSQSTVVFDGVDDLALDLVEILLVFEFTLLLLLLEVRTE